MMNGRFVNPYGKKRVNLSKCKVPVALKQYVVQELNDNTCTAASIAKFYSLKSECVRGWKAKHNKGGVLCESAGRSTKFSKTALKKVQDEMNASVFDVRSEDYQNLLQEAAQETAKERGLSINTVSMSQNTVLKASRSIGVGFTVGGKGAENVKVEYVVNSKRKKKQSREAPSRGRQVLPDEHDPNFTRYTIKYVLAMCAAGFQTDPVYVLQDENMTEDEFRTYPIKGLGVGTNVDNRGHVVITKSRAGNDAYHRWLFSSIMVPFIKKLREFYQLGEDQWAHVTMDGEPNQIPIVFEKEVREFLLANRIYVSKFPASTTSINQPCDARNCFRGPKTQNKKIGNKDVKGNTFMIAALTAMFKEHNEWLNSDERGDSRLRGRKKKYVAKKDKPNTIAMNTAHVNMAKYGLLRVQLALQLCMRPHMIRESFEATGLYPPCSEQVLANCHSRIKSRDYAWIRKKMPELVQLMKDQGEIYEKDFDRLQILCTMEREGKTLDELIIYRRRAIVLTHPEVVRRQEEYVQKKIAEERRLELKRKEALEINEVTASGKKFRLYLVA